MSDNPAVIVLSVVIAIGAFGAIALALTGGNPMAVTPVFSEAFPLLVVLVLGALFVAAFRGG